MNKPLNTTDMNPPNPPPGADPTLEAVEEMLSVLSELEAVLARALEEKSARERIPPWLR
jgi:hypothetical protein